MWLINFYWNRRYPELNNEEVKVIFEKHQSIIGFATYLYVEKFTYNHDGLNYTYILDTFERPNQVLARKFANCSGYMRLWQDYVEYMRNADEIIQYDMNNGWQWKLNPLGGQWHYISFIRVDNKWYLQSNVNIIEIASPESTLEVYKKEYKNITQIYSWKK